ncbi:M24 family metallopeptidase [Paracoccaceae bacterium Fryx2]|nr:M24 family metallopeptidase [Paracoccaceae bacterium Fryx2]
MIFHDRLTRLRARMRDTGTDLVAVGPTSNMVWLSGLAPHGDERPVMQIVTQGFAGFLMPALNADSQRPATDLPFFCWTDDVGPVQALADLLAAALPAGTPCTVALDETMRADFALLLLDALPVARRGFLGDTVGWLRSRKDAAEYDLLKMNAVLNDSAMRAGFAALRDGITESEVAAAIAAVYTAHGARAEFLSVCFGGNGAFPHHATGDTRLAPGMAVLIDIGGRKQGYPSDMTRVGHFGPAPEGFAEVHAIVNRAVAAAVAAARPGVAARTVDAAARDVITAAGYGDRFLHRTGHGLGIDIHEAPYITATADTVLEEGMVFSIEPGIYLTGRFGLRLEEIVILRADHAEILSDLPRDAFAQG